MGGECIKGLDCRWAVCSVGTGSLYARDRGVDTSTKGERKAGRVEGTSQECGRQRGGGVAG
ncbi:hypothetical protein [Salmonella enterica]|uniref:hypothetical protein n=1 Tax=Salmonella enterica TaxID=28901 RepID=UPI00398C3AAA